MRSEDVPCDHFLVNAGPIDDLHLKAGGLVLPTLTGRVPAHLGLT